MERSSRPVRARPVATVLLAGLFTAGVRAATIRAGTPTSTAAATTTTATTSTETTTEPSTTTATTTATGATSTAQATTPAQPVTPVSRPIGGGCLLMGGVALLRPGEQPLVIGPVAQAPGTESGGLGAFSYPADGSIVSASSIDLRTSGCGTTRP